MGQKKPKPKSADAGPPPSIEKVLLGEFDSYRKKTLEPLLATAVERKDLSRESVYLVRCGVAGVAHALAALHAGFLAEDKMSPVNINAEARDCFFDLGDGNFVGKLIRGIYMGGLSEQSLKTIGRGAKVSMDIHDGMLGDKESSAKLMSGKTMETTYHINSMLAVMFIEIHQSFLTDNKKYFMELAKPVLDKINPKTRGGGRIIYL